MGICDSTPNQALKPKNEKYSSEINNYSQTIDPNISKKISFRCIYDIKENKEIQIINDRYGNFINKDIKSKIKILNGEIKEEFLLLKKN